MADKFELVFTARLDENSQVEFMNAIKGIESKMPGVKVRLHIDDGEALSAITRGTDKFKLYRNAADEVQKVIVQTTHDQKGLISTTYELNAGTGKFIKTQSTVADSMDQAHANALKLNNTYSDQAIQQESLLNQIDKTMALNEAFIERGGLNRHYEDLRNTVEKLNPRSEDFNRNLKEQRLKFQQLGTQVSIVKKEISDASKFTNIFGQSIVDAGNFNLPLYREPVHAGCVIAV